MKKINLLKLRNKFSVYFYNPVSYAGVFLALATLVLEFFLFWIDFFSPNPSSYLGMFTYILLPPILILGLILIPWGAVWYRRRIKSGRFKLKSPAIYIDPSLPTHRNAIFVFTVGTIIFLTMSAIGSYKAFQYTESVKFCGTTCHYIMTPEYTRYLDSAHARVKCVECHIGPGAEWYFKYKLEGARQLVSAVRNSYERPIATPIHNLRPAKETCEHCHWPGKFFSSFELRKTYYPVDKSEDKSWFVRMLVKVGGDEGQAAGIHSHMYKDSDIYYVASDSKRQEIPWVKSVDKSGKEVIFTSPKSKYKDQKPAENLIRKMDCMDCHNRPSHSYKAPNKLVNESFINKKVNPNIPEIKSKMMQALTVKYKTTAEAIVAIPKFLNDYYQAKHPQYYQNHKDEILAAGKAAIEMFKSNFFPEMNARWDAYPENIGHLTSPGCFRCHDGEHKSADGQVISRDCNICHTIIEQGSPTKIDRNALGVVFKHPFNQDDSWKEMNCSDCHTGN